MKNLTLTLFLAICATLCFAQPNTLDKTFSGDGLQTTAIRTTWDEIFATALQPDGKIVAVGTTYLDPYDDIAVARYNADGSLDNSFSTDGMLFISIGNDDDFAQAVAIQKDGKILITGFTDNGDDYDIVVLRYNADGTLDNTFSSGGIMIPAVSVDKFDNAGSIVQLADGKILVGASSDDDICIVKLNSNGTLDNTFNSDGIAIVPLGGGGLGESTVDMAVQADGKIVVVGTAYVDASDDDFFVVRLNSDGTLDNTFSSDGKVITPVSTGHDYANAVAIQADGKIVVAGANDNEILVVRYNSNGTLDNTFSSDGIVVTAFIVYGYAKDLAIQTDGKIVVVGAESDKFSSDEEFVAFRYNTDGSVDNNFAVVQDFTASDENDDWANSVLIQPDDKIVVSGYSDNKFGLARYMGKNIGIIDFTVSKNSFLIYPNPVRSNTTFEYTLQNEEIITIQLLDLQGKLIKTFVSDEKQNIGKHEQSIELPANLTAGNYLMRISSPNGQMSIQLMK